jgi:hypothetical protein
MANEFSIRSRFVPVMFFGAGTTVESGDTVEAQVDDVRVKIAVEQVDGEAIAGAVVELQNDVQKLTQHDGLDIGSRVELRLEQVRSCWKAAA